MRVLSIIKYLFTALGLVFIAISIAILLNTRSFLAKAQSAPGTVVDLIQIRGDDGYTYKPRVRFTSPDGAEIEFVTSYSQSPAPYDVGESVEVLFTPGNPHDARIRGFGGLWALPSIFGFMGVIFAGIGGGILVAGIVGRKKKNYLMAYGTAIQTEFQGVERNGSLEVNGKNPWRIASQWLDPQSSKLRVFYSENLWFDPTRFVTQKQVTVLLDPSDPRRYHMDISFLPELEGSG
jgi:hypothetical protein